MGKAARSVWINDDGTLTKGTPLVNEELQKIYDGFEADTLSANFPDISTKSIIDNVLGTNVFFFGGRDDVDIMNAAYVAGSTPFAAGEEGVHIFHPGTHVMRADAAHLSGYYKFRAMMRATITSGGPITLGICRSDAPNVPFLELTSTHATGELVTSAATIAFTAPGTTFDYWIKSKVASDGDFGRAWGIQLIRVNG